MQISDLTLAAAAEQLERREISPVELTEGFIERIKKLNPTINAFITVTEQEALNDARRAEREIHGGKYFGPLHGIPIAVKDVFETAGVRTTAGSKILERNIPRRDATVVAKLRKSGAIMIGKANLHEWALGVTNNNPHYGATRNPWSPDRIPGGSSGGSASALAAHFCLGAIGSDTGGSIRIPASACGVVGIKPTVGLVSLHGVWPLSWSLDHAGPMTLTIMDLSILLEAIAGYDEDDPTSTQRPKNTSYATEMKQGLDGLRLAVPANYFFDDVQDDVRRAIRSAVKKFEELGATVTEVRLEGIEEDRMANRLIIAAEAATIHRERLKNRSDFGGDVLERLESGLRVSLQDYVQARRTQDARRRAHSLFFKDYDALITPTLPRDPPLIEGLNAVDAARDLTKFTAPFNLTGLPAISLPCGFSSNSLPIGMQLVANHWNESGLLRIAYAYESATDWHKRKPHL